MDNEYPDRNPDISHLEGKVNCREVYKLLLTVIVGGGEVEETETETDGPDGVSTWMTRWGS